MFCMRLISSLGGSLAGSLLRWCYSVFSFCQQIKIMWSLSPQYTTSPPRLWHMCPIPLNSFPKTTWHRLYLQINSHLIPKSPSATAASAGWSHIFSGLKNVYFLGPCLTLKKYAMQAIAGAVLGAKLLLQFQKMNTLLSIYQTIANTVYL